MSCSQGNPTQIIFRYEISPLVVITSNEAPATRRATSTHEKMTTSRNTAAILQLIKLGSLRKPRRQQQRR